MTDTLAELEALIGRPGALALCSMRGGHALYVPKRPDPGWWPEELIGSLMVARLVERFGGAELDLPFPPVSKARAAWVHKLCAENYLVPEIKEKTGLSERHIRRILADV